MSEISYIPVPYYQIAPYAKGYDYKTNIYKPVPNKKIHWHCPFIIIDSELINKPLKDIAIATAEDNSDQDLPHEDTATQEPAEYNTVERKTGEDSVRQDTKSNAFKTEELSNEVTSDTYNEDDRDPEKLAKEKERLDYLARQEAKPENRTDSAPSFKTITTPNSSLDNFNNNILSEMSTAKTPDSHRETVPDNLANKSLHANLQDRQAVDNESANEHNVSQHSPSPANENSIKSFQSDHVSNDNSDDDSVNKYVDNQEALTDQPSEHDDDKKANDGITNDKIEQNNNKNKKSKRKKDSKKEDEITEEEKLKIEKEEQLESYKQFVAEQESKVDVDYQGIRVSIEANALPSRMYFIMNALSAIIASYGLVINSAAVVIGAMLVAMMLGPISGVALAIIDYRMPFLRKSLITVLLGALMVVTIGFIVGWLHSDTQLSNEILSRTQPTSMDLMVALAGGTAGAYAMISPHLSVAVVGVAVATALVPPLAASGILFAHGEASLGLGALLLALTNIIAIQFTNALVLWFTGFRRLMEDDYKTSPIITFFRRNAVPLVLLAGIAGYLTYNFNTINKKQQFENEVKETINDYFIDKGNALTTTQFLKRENHQTVRAVMRGETRPSTTDVRHIERSINEMIDDDYPKYKPVRLQLRYMPVVVIESDPNQTEEISQTDVAILSND